MIFNVNSGAGKIPVNVVPSTNSSFTYDGNAKTPAWQNYDSEQLTISGSTSATNAGTYKVYFTPKSDYEWWDGTSTSKEVTWSIAKAAGSLSLSATSGTIVGKKNTATFTVNYNGDSAISVSSSNTSYATVALSGKTVTITATGYGSATITVSVSETNNYTKPSNKTYSVTVSVLYLYNAGNENTSVTGGWIAEAVYIGNWDGGLHKGTPVVTRNRNNMVVKANGTPSGGVVRCKNPINLTNFTTLKFEGSLDYTSDTVEARRTLCTWSSIPTYYWDQKGAWTALLGSGSVSKSVNVVNLSGNHYIGFGVCIAVGITVNKVWLE